MAEWRPLSRRGQADPRLDEPTEGLPPYLAGPLVDWLRARCWDGYRGRTRVDELTALQLSFKLEQPLNRFNTSATVDDLLERVAEDEEFGLDVIDYFLHYLRSFTDETEAYDELAGEANEILRLGGSVWEVARGDDDGSFQLSRRAVGPVREAIESVPSSTRAHQHLVAAWNRLSGRNPDASGAYREAVRAVEAAAKPIVLPSNDKATLGTMIAAIRDKPGKWNLRLGEVEDARRMMEAIWTGQLDRHGTDDEAVPLNVSLDEADAAFAISLSLVRLFVGGHIVPA